MKNLKFLAGIMIMSMMVCFTSCSGDGDSGSPVDSIVGSWKQVNDYGTEITITFNSDRTGRVQYEYTEDRGGSYEKFEYYYDTVEKELTVTGETQLNGRYDVVMTATKLILEKSYDDIVFEFKRI